MRFTQYATVFALAVITPATSHAQIGGLIKKATNAATNKAERKVVQNANLKPSNAFGPELTAESLDGVLRGLAATDAKLAEADQYRQTRMKLDDRLSKSIQSHEKDRETYDNLRIKIEKCQSDFREKRHEQLNAELERKRSDPAEQARVMAIAVEAGQKLAVAQGKGDTAAYRRIAFEMAKAQGIDPVADSAATLKACGPVPSKPTWLIEQDSIRAQSARSDSQIRAAEESAQTAGAAASGMPSKNVYAMARERVLHWYLEKRGSSPVQHFGDEEKKLMEGKRDAIEKLSRALQGGG